MNPHQQNKIDIKSLSPDEQRLLRMYGKIPNKKDLLQNKLKERKYFDSGDYALSKAGKASDVGVTSIGSRHPHPENIPHLAATSPPQGSHFNGHGGAGAAAPGAPHNGKNTSPVKEGSILRRSSAESQEALVPDPGQEKAAEGDKEKEKEKEEKEPQEQPAEQKGEDDPSPPPARDGLPIRR